MANVILTAPFADVTINAVNDYYIQPMNSGVVARWVIQLVSNTWTGSATIKGRLMGTAATPVAIPYIGLFVNNAVGTGAATTTALTNTSLIEVDASEVEVVVNVTASSANTATLSVRPVLG